MTTITVSKSELLIKIQAASKIISSKPILPIMQCVLLEAKEGRLYITATDASGRIESSIDCKADADINICIDTKILIDALKELPEQPINIHIDDRHGVRINYTGGRFEMMGQDPALFPETKDANDPVTLFVDAESLLEGINSVLFCVANDELRPVLNGVLFESNSIGFNCVGTDGCRMAIYSSKNGEYTKSSFVIPAKAAGIIKTLVKSQSGMITIHLGSNNVVIESEDFTITSILQEGRYPNYRSVIPKNEKKMIINTSSLKDAIRRISLFANPVSQLIVFSLSKNSLLVKGQDIDYASNAEETISCEYIDEPFEIGMKAAFMVEILSHISTEQSTLSFSGPSTAILITPVSEDPEVERTYLQMPLSINN